MVYPKVPKPQEFISNFTHMLRIKFHLISKLLIKCKFQWQENISVNELRCWQFNSLHIFKAINACLCTLIKARMQWPIHWYHWNIFKKHESHELIILRLYYMSLSLDSQCYESIWRLIPNWPKLIRKLRCESTSIHPWLLQLAQRLWQEDIQGLLSEGAIVYWYLHFLFCWNSYKLRLEAHIGLDYNLCFCKGINL